MADNVTVPGTGAVLAFDECTIGGVAVEVARGKLGFGTDGSYTEVSPGVGLPVAIQGLGVGDLAAIGAASTNGTALGTKPGAATRAALYLPAGSSVTYTIAGTAPSAAPAATITLTSSGGTVPDYWEEALAGAQMIYLTAKAGAPLFRWI